MWYIVVHAPQIPHMKSVPYGYACRCGSGIYVAEILHAMQLANAIKVCQLDIDSCIQMQHDYAARLVYPCT